MKPLSERLKDFPNAQFVDWLCLACVDVREIRTPDDAQEEINKIRDAVTGRLASLMQRAEAAEAKLAEMEKQEPVGHFMLARDEDDSWWYEASEQNDKAIPLFTRPAPAADLAEMVPGEMFMSDTVKANLPTEWMDGFNACRAAILRNIEEKLK